jgi:phosphatidate cytidylyltransferase
MTPMHLKRWLTGIIATPILIYVVGFGPRWLFHLLLLLVALQGLREFFRMTSPETPEPLRFGVYGTTFLLFASVSGGKLFLWPVIIFLWAAVPMLCLIFTYGRAESRSTEILAKTVLGPLYISLPLAMFTLIERHPGGRMWIFFLLLIVFACDTGAFYAGRTFGKRKLHPLVSPGKTWAGAVGGVLASLVAAFIWSRFSNLHPFDARMVLLAGALAVSGQFGDLAESMLKRNHGVKDSGALLPGHGGILDRIDAHLFAAPVLLAYLSW